MQRHAVGGLRTASSFDSSLTASCRPWSCELLLAMRRSPFTGHTLRSFADTYLLSLQAVYVFVGWFALHVRITELGD